MKDLKEGPQETRPPAASRPEAQCEIVPDLVVEPDMLGGGGWTIFSFSFECRLVQYTVGTCWYYWWSINPKTFQSYSALHS